MSLADKFGLADFDFHTVGSIAEGLTAFIWDAATTFTMRTGYVPHIVNASTSDYSQVLLERLRRCNLCMYNIAHSDNVAERIRPSTIIVLIDAGTEDGTQINHSKTMDNVRLRKNPPLILADCHLSRESGQVDAFVVEYGAQAVLAMRKRLNINPPIAPDTLILFEDAFNAHYAMTELQIRKKMNTVGCKYGKILTHTHSHVVICKKNDTDNIALILRTTTGRLRINDLGDDRIRFVLK